MFMGIQEDIVCFFVDNKMEWFTRNQIAETIGNTNLQSVTHALGKLSNFSGEGFSVKMNGTLYRIKKQGERRYERMYGLFEEK